MERALNDPFRLGDGRFRDLEDDYNIIEWGIVWNHREVVDLWRWSFCGGGPLMRFYCGYFPVTYMCSFLLCTHNVSG